ncbi:MAG: TIGR04222 domain-containing membrane protein [Candidatus Eremiobacteraeota bacterium]|nr:TIGR04222 domain-containing membrane protein [Candidatus Eremiobacteraeota bacterium]MCW5871485.1 TIGR04222 domain-containing membrane protein [Candidatus Eremiobacteraeota bacterium]
MIDLLTLQFLKGPAFLTLYLALTIGCHMLAARWTSQLHLASTGRTSPHPLNTYHLALLQGDKQRALLSALVRLEAAGAIKIDAEAKPPTVVRLEDVRVEDGLEAAVLANLDKPRSLAELAKANSVEARLELLEDELYAQDLLVPSAAVTANAGKLNWIFGPLLGLGLARLAIGVSLHRPVGLLFFILFISFVCSFIHRVPNKRNYRGEKIVQDHLSRCAALKATADSSAKSQLSSQDLALAAALFGTSALATALMPATSSSGGCGSSSSCGSSCGGGCGGGCGGCGG